MCNNCDNNHYLSSKIIEKNKSQNKIKDLITLFEIAPVNRTVIEEALKSKFSYFEDSVIYHAAHHAGIDMLHR